MDSLPSQSLMSKALWDFNLFCLLWLRNIKQHMNKKGLKYFLVKCLTRVKDSDEGKFLLFELFFDAFDDFFDLDEGVLCFGMVVLYYGI